MRGNEELGVAGGASSSVDLPVLFSPTNSVPGQSSIIFIFHQFTCGGRRDLETVESLIKSG